MADRTLADYVHKIGVGLRLRCPHCERGRLFKRPFRMTQSCPYCRVRYERASGESLGGMMVNLILLELVTIGGFFLSEFLFHPPLAFQIVFWVTFNLALCVLTYHPARGVWVSVAYLTGGVYADEPAKPLDAAENQP